MQKTRIFRDMELVEHLGSGMQRILKSYDANIFHVSEHFFEIRFPMDARGLAMMSETEIMRPESRPESALARKLVSILFDEPAGKAELAKKLGHTSISGELNKQIKYLLNTDWIEMTIPNKPQSRLQKYQLTSKGRQWMDLQKRS